MGLSHMHAQTDLSNMLCEQAVTLGPDEACGRSFIYHYMPKFSCFDVSLDPDISGSGCQQVGLSPEHLDQGETSSASGGLI